MFVYFFGSSFLNYCEEVLFLSMTSFPPSRFSVLSNYEEIGSPTCSLCPLCSILMCQKYFIQFLKLDILVHLWINVILRLIDLLGLFSSLTVSFMEEMRWCKRSIWRSASPITPKLRVYRATATGFLHSTLCEINVNFLSPLTREQKGIHNISVLSYGSETTDTGLKPEWGTDCARPRNLSRQPHYLWPGLIWVEI